MTDRPTTLPPFTTATGVTFRCLVADAGPNELGIPAVRYVWRSDCNRYAAGRRGKLCWSRCDGRVVGAGFPSISKAMAAAIAATRRGAA